jgi:hypothetical protein
VGDGVGEGVVGEGVGDGVGTGVSFLQYLEQPSPLSLLPSSHSSPSIGCTIPSPQYCTFVSAIITILVTPSTQP